MCSVARLLDIAERELNAEVESQLQNHRELQIESKHRAHLHELITTYSLDGDKGWYAVYEWRGGACYRGEVVRQKAHGIGLRKESTGLFSGLWKDAEPVLGVYTPLNAHDSVYEGHWQHGKHHGPGIETDKRGGIWSGDWTHGFRSKFGTYLSEAARTQFGTSGTLTDADRFPAFLFSFVLTPEHNDAVTMCCVICGLFLIFLDLCWPVEGSWKDSIPHGMGIMYYEGLGHSFHVLCFHKTGNRSNPHSVCVCVCV